MTADEDYAVNKRGTSNKPSASSGGNIPWHQGWKIDEEERTVYRDRSRKSQEARNHALAGSGPRSIHPINVPRLDLSDLMPPLKSNGIRALSLFSGGGGLDLGFNLAGFVHLASYEILPFAATTLKNNQPDWKIYGGDAGDVTKIDWRDYQSQVDVIHAGPPCQPFSAAGRQNGREDLRDMFPEFVRAVLAIKPKVFLAENVLGLAAAKFKDYLQETVIKPLSEGYSITTFQLQAASFGVPQVRKRLFFLGIKDKVLASNYQRPLSTHYRHHLGGNREQSNSRDEGIPLSLNLDNSDLEPCMGAREALGLPDIGYDDLVPTLRSTLTGPRHTTSILSSVSAQQKWDELKIWPNGVALTRALAHSYPAKNNHFRLSVPDCSVLQGFPESWKFDGPVYKAVGQIGNAVAPPVAYALAKSIAQLLC